MTSRQEDAIIGCLLGSAVGDAIGLPFEGLSAQRQQRLCPELKGHHFFFGRGMVSDDTEHACITAQALIASAGGVPAFTQTLTRQLRLWLILLPAGTGWATLCAVLRLWMGFPAERSGVFSAGNGPAMRSAILGVCYGSEIEKLRELVRASTRLTHTDPRAEFGAFAVALAAHMASTQDTIDSLAYLRVLHDSLGVEANELLELVKKAVASVTARQSTESFAAELGLNHGVSGYIYHTVPVVLHAWLVHQKDYRSAIIEIVRCGGDTDSTAAIVGGIIGASIGKAGIPQEWLDGLWEWPRSVPWMEQLGTRLAEVCAQGMGQSPLPLSVFWLFVRNFLFLLIVLLHGLRRLLPPY